MAGYLLDTSIASALEPSRVRHAAPFVEWMRVRGEQTYLSTVALFEIAQGIAKLRRERSTARAEAIEAWRDVMLAAFELRLLGVSVAVADSAGKLSDYAHAAGRHPGLADILIAATAQVHDLTLLTRNVRHFEPLGVRVADPLTQLPD
jgi:predicted nucleic acid-binding protein